MSEITLFLDTRTGKLERVKTVEEIRADLRSTMNSPDHIRSDWTTICPGCYGTDVQTSGRAPGLVLCRHCHGVFGITTEEVYHKFIPTWWAKNPNRGAKPRYFDVCRPAQSGNGWTRTHGWFIRSGVTQIG